MTGQGRQEAGNCISGKLRYLVVDEVTDLLQHHECRLRKQVLQLGLGGYRRNVVEPGCDEQGGHGDACRKSAHVGAHCGAETLDHALPIRERAEITRVLLMDPPAQARLL